MTDEEILATADACGLMLFGLGLDKAKFEFCILAFAKQIAKLDRHHEREALAQEQEPVAWVAEDVCEGQYINGRPRKIWWECEKGVGTAFYATPPQRIEQNFCSRCGKRVGGIDSIHTCTPPMEKNT
jgi:hypothetical protein